MSVWPGLNVWAIAVCGLLLTGPLVANAQSSWPAEDYTAGTLDELIESGQLEFLEADGAIRQMPAKNGADGYGTCDAERRRNLPGAD